MDKVLEVRNLSKSYGKKEVLKNISFSLNRGKVMGVLGPNGEGKTTLLNTIVGLLYQSSGEILLEGEKLPIERKKKISFLQDKNVMAKWMKVKDAEKFYKRFFDDFSEKKMNEMVDLMVVDGKAKINSLSKGNIEKVNLALALSREVPLYILDEPISGIDIITREKIIKAIIGNIDEDSSMIITTHFIGELENLFDEVIFLKDGVILEGGDAEELRVKYGTSIEGIYKKIFGEG